MINKKGLKDKEIQGLIDSKVREKEPLSFGVGFWLRTNAVMVLALILSAFLNAPNNFINVLYGSFLTTLIGMPLLLALIQNKIDNTEK